MAETSLSSDTSLGVIVKDLLSNSSAHGLPNIYQSSHWIHRALWTILFLGGVGAVTWQVTEIFLKFQSSPYQVNVDHRFESNLPFPAVTICNVNPVLKRKLEQADPSFRELFDTNYVPPSNVKPPPPTTPAATTAAVTTDVPLAPGPPAPAGPPSIAAITTETTTPTMNTTTESLPSWDERATGDFFRKQSDVYEKSQMLITLLANKTLETRMDLGHDLNHMLISCEWNGYPCSPRNFTRFYHHKYGNCFTFNSMMYNQKLAEVITAQKPGPLYGLSLELNAEQHEYMDGITTTAGFKVVVHEPDKMPFPEDEGISISPGYETSVGIRVLDIQRLGEPWASCDTDINDDDMEDYYEANYGVTYSMKTCERSCYQYYVIKECGCADPRYPFPSNLSDVDVCLLAGSIADEPTIDCVDAVNTDYRRGELGCEQKCPLRCYDRGYISSISLGMWPSDGYSKTLLDNMLQSNDEVRRLIRRNSSPLDWIKSNIARVQVFYQEFNYEYIEQSPSYGVLDLLSDIGGQLGLWIGVSVLTICEMVQYVGLIVGFLVRKFCLRKRSNRITTPVQQLHSDLNKDLKNLPV